VSDDKTQWWHPAFPDARNGCYGLTKREYFAACALQGILAADRCGDFTSANNAVDQADAIIEALNNDRNKEIAP
jgi:hypothetical protein